MILVVFGVGVVAGHLEDLVGNKVLAGAVALDDGGHHILRNVLIVGQELLGVFGEAVAAVAKAGVVVVSADAGVKTDAVDDVLSVESFHLGIGVELVEIADAQGEVGVGEELHRLSLFHADEQTRDAFVWCRGVRV